MTAFCKVFTMENRQIDIDLNRSWEYPGSHLKWGFLESFNLPDSEIWVDIYLTDNRVLTSVNIAGGVYVYHYHSDPFINRLPGDFGLAEEHVKSKFGFADSEVLLIRKKNEQMNHDKCYKLKYPYGFFQEIGIIPISWGEKKYNVNDWIARIEHFDELPKPSDLDIYRRSN